MGEMDEMSDSLTITDKKSNTLHGTGTLSLEKEYNTGLLKGKVSYKLEAGYSHTWGKDTAKTASSR